MAKSTIKKNVKPKIVTVGESGFTIPANGMVSKTYDHSESGYRCYFLQGGYYVSNRHFYYKVKNEGENSVVLDIVNEENNDIVLNGYNVTWLCIPI
jgi:hypothetical protein